MKECRQGLGIFDVDDCFSYVKYLGLFDRTISISKQTLIESVSW